MIELLAVFVTIFVICACVFGLLNFLGADCYPSPKFTCAECEQAEKKYGTYFCKACRDEIDNCLLSCAVARRTRECYKNARRESNEQHDRKE